MSTLTKPSRLVKLFMRATTSAPSLFSNNLNQKSDDDDGGEDAEKVLIWRRRKNLRAVSSAERKSQKSYEDENAMHRHRTLGLQINGR